MKKSIILLVGGLLLFASCSSPLFTRDTPPVPKGTVGRVSIQIPAVADWLAPYVKNAGTSRALLRATSVKVYVQTSGGTDVIAPVTQTVSVTGGSASSTTLALIDGVPVGTNYEVSVQVFNSDYATGYPVVSGSKTGVAVTKDTTTDVAVTCVPYYTSVLNPNVNGSAALTPNSEIWYQLTTIGGVAYTLSQTNPNTPTFLFDSTGQYIGSATSSQSYAWTPAVATTYFVGISNVAATSQTSSVLATGVVPLVNEGSIAAPVTLSLDASHTFTMGVYGATDDKSYYKFTTTTAGDYYLTLPSGYVYFSIYTDSSFTTLLTSGYCSSGSWFTSLAATTTYYLRLQNYYSSKSTPSGSLLSPSGIATTTLAEGTPATPVSLALATSHAGKVGYSGLSTRSYYKFTTGTSVNYHIGLATISGGSSGVSWTLGTGPSSYSFSGTDSSGTDVILNPNTDYWLTTLQNNTTDFSAASQTTYDLTVAAQVPPDGTALVLDQWTQQTLAGSTQYFKITLNPGTYTVAWEDSFQKNATTVATGDIKLSAYNDDYSATYFSNVDSGYLTPQTLVITGSVPQTVRFFVNPFSAGGVGTYWIGVSTPSSGSLNITVN